MEKAALQELGFSARTEAVSFLKRLWRGEKTGCPLCGAELEPLHRKAKKSGCDWQCRACGKVYRTVHLLDELNEHLPD